MTRQSAARCRRGDLKLGRDGTGPVRICATEGERLPLACWGQGGEEVRRQGDKEGWRDGGMEKGGAASDRKQIQTDVSECGSAACESVSVFVCVGRTTHTTRDQAGGESV